MQHLTPLRMIQAILLTLAIVFSAHAAGNPWSISGFILSILGALAVVGFVLTLGNKHESN